MKNTIIKLIAIVFILMGMNFVFAMEVAITVDDLPKHMNLLPNTSRLDIAKKMLASLKKHSLYNVYGFINAGNSEI
jgi:hypothetical protein